VETISWILFVAGLVLTGMTILTGWRAHESRLKVFDDAIQTGFISVLALSLILRSRPARAATLVVMGMIMARGLWVLRQRRRDRDRESPHSR